MVSELFHMVIGGRLVFSFQRLYDPLMQIGSAIMNQLSIGNLIRQGMLERVLQLRETDLFS